MCNLYTYKMSRDEMRSLKLHFTLIGKRWADVFEKRMEGRNDEARKLFEQAISIRRDDSSAINNLGVLYVNMGQMNDAVAAFQDRRRHALRFPPLHPDGGGRPGRLPRGARGLDRHPVGLEQKEATMIHLPNDWFLYLAAGAMGLFMLTMMFVTVSERRHP